MNNPTCPVCGGQKSTQIDGNQYRCEYCGHTFVPVQQQPAPQQQPSQGIQINFNAQPSTEGKSRVTTAVFALFLGGLGIHHFYLGNILKGVLYLVFCWTWIPGILGLVEGILLLTQSDEEFAVKPKLLF